VAGAVHTTADTLRPALQAHPHAAGRPAGVGDLLHAAPDEVVIYGDCAVNPDPDAEQLADFALQSAESARAFGIEPRVAMLSYSTGVSGSGSAVEKVAEATRIARELAPRPGHRRAAPVRRGGDRLRGPQQAARQPRRGAAPPSSCSRT
jgi:phosphate acetyltransferase